MSPTKKVIFLLALITVCAAPAAAVDTLYIRQTDTIVIRETRYKKVAALSETPVQEVVQAVNKDGCEDKVFFVYFPLGRYSIDDAAKKAIQEMATRLEEHPDQGVRLTGYCDYVGSSDLNDRLSVARAENVRNRLQEVHGIAGARIAVEGKGKLENVRGEYSANRRVEMRMVPLSELTAAADAQPSEMREQQKAAPTATEVKVVATEEVSRYTTLARLARKYYNNTFCWVYIYAMNKGNIPNPNSLRIGQKLSIPELSEVDRQITKQESEEYYRMIRR